MPESTDVRLLRSARELQAFVPAWRRLWSADPAATPFQSPEWLLPWWRQFGTTDLRAAVLMRGGRPTCLLPLYVYDGTVMLLGIGTSDYLDGIFAPQCGEAEVFECLQAALDPDGWHTLAFAQLRRQSNLLQALANTGMATFKFDSEACSRMKAVEMAGLPTKIRRNAMYYRNRARRQGSLELCIAGTATCAAQFEELVRMHTARWRECGQGGLLADERILAWHREAVPLLQASGILRLVSLRLNGESIATLYSLIDPPERPERTQYFYLPAYSPAYAELRPGTLLLAAAMEHAAREGVMYIDMLRGDEPYKQLWHLEQVATTGVELDARDWREETAA